MEKTRPAQPGELDVKPALRIPRPSPLPSRFYLESMPVGGHVLSRAEQSDRRARVNCPGAWREAEIEERIADANDRNEDFDDAELVK